MSKILLVGLGGFLGAISRYGLGQLIRSYFPHPFPIATLAINFLGCVGIGLLIESFRNHPLFPSLNLLIAIGFLGAFTTFSTFSFETLELVKRDQFQFAVLNVVASVVLCLAGAMAGEWLGRSLRA
jgi:fluoride exporter